MASKSKASEKILELQLKLNKVVLELKNMTEEGKGSVAEFEKLKKKFEELAGAVKGAEASVNRSFGQRGQKDAAVYKDRLQQLITAFNKIKSANNEIDRQVKKQTEEQTKRRKKQIEQEQRLLRSSIREGNAQRTAALNQFEARQKEFRRRRAAREKQIEKEITNNAIKEQKRRDQAAQRRDFRGGFAGQLTPRAIGGALGSLTKYLGLYRLVTAAAQAFNEITIGSVKQAIDFEKQLANLGAVAGVTGQDLQKLGKNALDVSTSTKFTATEVIGLQTELSKLGFTAEDVIAATEGIAFTAQALGSPLNATAEQIGKVVNQFDLLIEQSQFIGDVLVTSINNSALSFDSFGTAIQYVGPIARNLGLTFEQTAGAMAVLADNGFTASRIGTGLRGIFTELGKTSADVESSLKSLAEQNISLSEAVDLVGKRNAAQLITLLDNIDAIDEANDKYYQQGRALVAAAQQSDTFAGQMEILTSSFREFQIEIGTAIAESDLLLGVLDALFTKGARTARGFKAINEIGFESFNEGAEKVSKGADELTTALDLLGVTQEKYNEIVDNAKVSTIAETLVSLNPFKDAEVQDEAIAAQNEIQGVIDKLREYAEETQRLRTIQSGQTQAQEQYEESVNKLTEAFAEGNNVNAEANELFRQLNNDIEVYQSIVDDGGKSVYNFVTGKTDLVAVSEDEKLAYEALVKALKGYQDQVQNSIISDKQLKEQQEKDRKKAISKEKKRIQEEIKDIDKRYKAQEDRINRSTELEVTAQKQILESELSTEEERTAAIKRIAELEESRQQVISSVYKRKAEAIESINRQYEENEKLITNALDKAEAYAAIYDNDIVKDAAKALKDFRAETSRLTKEREAGNISQEEYNTAIQQNQDVFEAYIKNLIASNNLGEDAEKILLNMVEAFDRMGISIGNIGGEAAVTSLKEFADKLRNDEEFRREFFGDLMSKSVDAAAESFSAFNDVALENTKNRLESELEEIKNRYKIEEDILKASLDNQIITENQYRAKQKELQKAQIAEENALNKQIFDAEKKQDRNSAIIDGTAAAASAFVNAYKTGEPITAQLRAVLSASIIAAQTVAQVAAINSRKFFPVKYESGGVVNGPSHSSGGVPFTVQGQAGYEMEGGEFIVNKKATAMHRDLLERINGSDKTNPKVGKTHFQSGGLVSAVNNESVNYLKAIAEATTSTAISSSKPVRAFISSKDLRSNENERRLRDRNDRI